MYDKNTNKIIGTIEAPFLVDADGKEDYKSVEYKLEKDGENEALKVIVSNDYFENEATKYPVTIDPTMVWMFDYLTTASTKNGASIVPMILLVFLSYTNRPLSFSCFFK